jgi:hypothetical protein
MLRNVHVRIFSDIPAIATENFTDVVISLCITTCFGPYGPSSGEYNYYLKHLRDVVIQRVIITSIKCSDAIAVIFLKRFLPIGVVAGVLRHGLAQSIEPI